MKRSFISTDASALFSSLDSRKLHNFCAQFTFPRNELKIDRVWKFQQKTCLFQIIWNCAIICLFPQMHCIKNTPVSFASVLSDISDKVDIIMI